MIIRTLDEAKGTPLDVTTEGKWNSVRLLVASDAMGFSFHVTTIFAGTTLHTHYENHLEAVYCVDGSATITYEEGRRGLEVAPGTLYALDKHDKHVLTAHTDLTLICVFNPAVTGHEKHNATGGYDTAE